LNFEVLCKQDVRTRDRDFGVTVSRRDRDETETFEKMPRDRLEAETFETETTTLK